MGRVDVTSPHVKERGDHVVVVRALRERAEEGEVQHGPKAIAPGEARHQAFEVPTVLVGDMLHGRSQERVAVAEVVANERPLDTGRGSYPGEGRTLEAMFANAALERLQDLQAPLRHQTPSPHWLSPSPAPGGLYS